MQRLVVVLAALALLASMVGPAAAQDNELEVTIAPAVEGRTAVRSSQRIEISGTAPPGAITEVRLFGRLPDGSIVEQPLPSSIRNRAATDSADGIQNSDGSLSGLITLGPPFPPQCRESRGECGTGPDVAYLTVTIAQNTTDTSNEVPVDFIRPELLRYDVTVIDREQAVNAIFSEPVVLDRAVQDSGVDWTITDPSRQVLAVERRGEDCDMGRFMGASGCTRRLRYGQSMGEDATPFVAYRNLTNRPAYVDGAGNTLVQVDQAEMRAADRVRPPRPSLTALGGKDPNSASVNNDNPVSLTVGNFTTGHTLEVRVDGVVRATVTNHNQDNAVAVPLNAGDKTYAITAVAIDPNGNRSDQVSFDPPRTDGQPAQATYTLDTVAPRLLTAVVDSPTKIDVSLTESVTPPGSAGRWVVTRSDGSTVTTSAVMGSGSTRTLNAPTGVSFSPGGGVFAESVAWSADGGTYEDAAGNGLVTGSIPLPPPTPLAPPVVTNPANSPTYRKPGPQTISGTVPAPATEVSLEKDGEEVTRADVQADGTWSFTRGGVDGEKLEGYSVRGRDSGAGQSTPTGVPTIIVDGTAPEVTVTNPVLKDVLPTQERRPIAAQGSSVAVAWRVTDDYFDRLRVTAVYDDADDDAAPNRPPEVIRSGIPNPDSGLNARVPDDFVGEITYVVTAVDRAGNEGESTSVGVLVFDDVIGLTNPILVANGVVGGSGGRLSVDFTEAVTGTQSGDQWRSDNGLGAEERTPFAARLSGQVTATLEFERAFPGPPDRNATPAVRFVGGGIDPLTDADGNRPISDSTIQAPDTVVPLLNVSTGNQGPTNLPDADERIRITGSTETTARPNRLVITSSAQTGPVVDMFVSGAFDVMAAVARNALTRLTVTMTDPAGLTAAPTIIEVIEDSLTPVLQTASLVSPTEVEVTISEAVTPNGDTGTWTVLLPDGTVVDAVAAGTGATRTLTRDDDGVFFDGPVTSGVARVRWRADGMAYRDAAGNEMLDGLLTLVPPAPLPLPVVRVPAASPTYRQPGQQTISGTASSGTTQVELLRAGQPVATVDVVDGRWSTTVDGADGDKLDDYEVRAINDVGGRSALAGVPTMVVDGTPPVVTVTEPSPKATTLLIDDDRRVAAQGADVVVSWQINAEEPHFDTLQVTAEFADADGTPNRDPLVVRTGIRSREGSLTATTPDDFVGQITYLVQAVDLAGNEGEARSHPILVAEGVIGLVRGELTLNPIEPATGAGARISVSFTDAVDGSTSGGEWRADDGFGAGQRSPLSARVADGRNAALDFAQSFPGPPDRNAEPRIAYVGGPGIGGLSDADGGNDPISDLPTLARDIQPPLLTVTTGGAGPVNLPTDSLMINGSTETSARDNTLIVTATTSDGQGFAQTEPSAVISQPINGQFSVEVDVAPDRTTTFTIEVEDPSGNTAEPRTITIVEDSAPPIITRLRPGLASGELVIVPLEFSEVVGQVTLEYDAGDDQFQPIDTISVNADATTYNWNDLPDGIDLQRLRVRATATDLAGNVSDPLIAPLRNLPAITAAVFVDETHVMVTTSEPVTTDVTDGAGFAVRRGPGVQATSTEGTQITLTLDTALEPSADRVTYNGQGEWFTPDGRPLRPGSAPLIIPTGVIRSVTDLVAGPDGDGGVVLSYVDERNFPAQIAGYEISRDAEVLGVVSASTRVTFDEDAPATGTLAYSVVTVGQNGLRSDPVTVGLTVGPTPVPGAPGRDAAFGGTGAATDSTILQDCPFTATPTITPADGGSVVSCDGRVAALVPPGVADTALFGKLIRRAESKDDGFGDITDTYQLVLVASGSFATVDAFEGYTELSFRDLRTELTASTPELVTALRVNDELAQEQAPRVGAETVAIQILTVGSFRTVQADGRTIRVFGPDPAIAADRFATAVGLSQTQQRRAGAAVIARADDYPDALSSAPLAALIGGPVLLARTTDVPLPTVYELRRLGVTRVTIVGGTAAVSANAEGQLIDLGFTVERIGGANRFETAAMIAREVGSVDNNAFVATGQNFADALSASAPASGLGRPILLTPGSQLIDVTRDIVRELGIVEAHIVGGTAAVTQETEDALRAAGPNVIRSSGRTRYETAIDLVGDLLALDLLDLRRPLIASGDGDGVTSPDALAAGPVAGRLGAPLLLAPKEVLPAEVEAFLDGASDIRGLMMAGGPAAITDDVRALVDATG